MATPLARLLQDVLHEPDVRAQFAAGPESFFADHGYDHLDAADVREALFVLADGAEPEAAGDYQSGADAIGDTPGLAELDGIAGAAAGLASAVARILGAPQLDDPTDPRAPGVVAAGLVDWCRLHAISNLDQLIGAIHGTDRR